MENILPITLGANIASLRGIRELDKSSDSLARVSERLASGLRINHPSDDAASLSISMKLKTDVRVYTQAIRNINDGISYTNVAEGALQSLSEIVGRQRELAEQASNGTYSPKQTLALNNEANALKNEYNRIVKSTKFNGQNVLNGVNNNIWIQEGYGDQEALNIKLGDSFGYAAGDGTFSLSQTGNVLTGGVGGYTMAAADYDGDGILDLLVTTDSNKSIVYTGNGDGTFRAATTITGDLQKFKAFMNPDSIPSFAVAGDFNTDGVRDFLKGGLNRIDLVLGTSPGVYSNSSTQVLSASNYFEGLASGDLNGDDKTDAVGLSYATGQVVFLISTGDGTFDSSHSFNAGAGVAAATIVDVDGDGISDLILSNSGTQKTQVYIGNGDGTFKIGASYSNHQGGHSYLLNGDFNGDGISDFVTYNTEGFDVMVGNADSSGRRNNLEYAFDFSTQASSRAALDKTATLLNKISSELGNIGAAQSRLKITSNVLQVRTDAYEAARSQLEDSDVAEESAQYVKLQILQKVGASVLAQANLQPNLVLKLLSDN